MTLDRIEVLDGSHVPRRLGELVGYQPGWGELSEADAESLRQLMGS